MEYTFRQATSADIDKIWEILQGAIARRKADGSQQWQDGYPNPEVVSTDIKKGCGFVLQVDDVVIGYTALLINDEPAYAHIEGKWLTNSDFVVFHRVAIDEAQIGKGLSKLMLSFIEAYAQKNGINSVKADTNFDNAAMLKIFERAGYQYCGEVFFRGAARKAFEKVLSQ